MPRARSFWSCARCAAAAACTTKRGDWSWGGCRQSCRWSNVAAYSLAHQRRKVRFVSNAGAQRVAVAGSADEGHEGGIHVCEAQSVTFNGKHERRHCWFQCTTVAATGLIGNGKLLSRFPSLTKLAGVVAETN